MTDDYTTATSVDEVKLEDTIFTMNARQTALQTRIDELERVKQALGTIRRVQSDPSDNTSALVNPPDELLGTVLTDARRLEIYRGCMAKANKLLVLTEKQAKTDK